MGKLSDKEVAFLNEEFHEIAILPIKVLYREHSIFFIT